MTKKTEKNTLREYENTTNESFESFLKTIVLNLKFLPPSSTSALVGEGQSVLYEPAPSPLL